MVTDSFLCVYSLSYITMILCFFPTQIYFRIVFILYNCVWNALSVICYILLSVLWYYRTNRIHKIYLYWYASLVFLPFPKCNTHKFYILYSSLLNSQTFYLIMIKVYVNIPNANSLMMEIFLYDQLKPLFILPYLLVS